MRQPKHKRTAAQKQAAKKFAAGGRASQATKRAAEKAKGQPTRTKAQTQASQKFAAAGRAAQARKRSGLKPLPTHQRALAAPEALIDSAAAEWLAGGNQVLPCCVAAAVANHLFAWTGTAATDEEIWALHLAAGGDEHGALIPHLLEEAAVTGLAGYRITRFWPVTGPLLPGALAGFRSSQGAHAGFAMSPATCVSWGITMPLPGEVEEHWWAEWR